MSARDRYVLEGEWSGYTSGQRRVVHREVIGPKRADRLRQLHSIEYTDGTSLTLSIRPAQPRERVQEIHGYTKLIYKAEQANMPHVHVVDLQ